jgi:tagatose-6-phosphate ketose/aldose isomerase
MIVCFIVYQITTKKEEHMAIPINTLTKHLDEYHREIHGCIHTATEIMAQPALWRQTGALIEKLLPKLVSFWGPSSNLLFSGAGSSHYVGMSITPALKRVFSTVEAISSTEMVMDPESSFPREEFVLISFARSGESPETNAVISLAEKLRPGSVKHVAITCNPDGSLAHIVDGLGKRGFVIVLPEGTNDRGLAMTSSFTSMAVAGFMLRAVVHGDVGRYREKVDALANIGERFLNDFPEMASRMVREGFQRIFFVASRPCFGGALEAHLKVQELSGGEVMAKAEDTLGFRHGFMAAVNSESLLVILFSSDPYRRLYEIDLAKELRKKKMGKKIVAICNKREDIEGLADYIFQTDSAIDSDDDNRAMMVTLAGQIIGFFVALSLGLNPDAPSPEGVIHRVVSGVTIYPYSTSENKA